MVCSEGKLSESSGLVKQLGGMSHTAFACSCMKRSLMPGFVRDLQLVLLQVLLGQCDAAVLKAHSPAYAFRGHQV